MGVPKRMAVAVSGLVFAGTAALAVGAASPAGAQVTVVAPGRLVSSGCGGGGCRTHNRHRFSNWHTNHFRHHQRVIVINRNNNFGRSESGQHQRNLHRQEMEERPMMFRQKED